MFFTISLSSQPSFLYLYSRRFSYIFVKERSHSSPVSVWLYFIIGTRAWSILRTFPIPGSKWSMESAIFSKSFLDRNLLSADIIFVWKINLLAVFSCYRILWWAFVNFNNPIKIIDKSFDRQIFCIEMSYVKKWNCFNC